jgi:hypothetical protein
MRAWVPSSEADPVRRAVKASSEADLTRGSVYPSSEAELLVANAFPWGRVSGPVGLAPEDLQERECACWGFLTNFHQWAWYLFQPALAMFQPASVTRVRLVPFAFGAPQEV